MFRMDIVPGRQAGQILVRSGLLCEDQDLPIDPQDVLRFLQHEHAYAVICCRDGIAQGYVVCCKRIMEQQIPELFILQAVGDGGSDWVDEGWRQMHAFAASLGCRRIGTIFPVDRARSLCRRFDLRPEGVYCTTIVRGAGGH